jgi:hypothetical protein
MLRWKMALGTMMMNTGEQFPLFVKGGGRPSSLGAWLGGDFHLSFSRFGIRIE